MELVENLIVTDVKDIVTVYSKRGDNEVVHNRPSYALSFCKSGRIEYEHNGRRIVSVPNVAVLHPMGATYRLFRQESGEFPLINFYLYSTRPVEEFLTFPIKDPQWYFHGLDMLKERALQPHNRLQVISGVYALLHRLTTESGGKTGTVRTLLNYIDEHYDESTLSNACLARHVGISEVYMRQLFRREVGMSPKKYIQHLRLQRAQSLLCEGTLSVTEIAARCGFSDIYPFTRAFKELTGETPTAYRRKNRYQL